MALTLQYLTFFLVSLPILASARNSAAGDPPQGEEHEGGYGGYSTPDDPSASVTWSSARTTTSSSYTVNSLEITAHPLRSHHTNITSTTDLPPNTTTPYRKKMGTRKLSGYFPSYNAVARPVSDIRYDLYDELSFFVATTNDNFTIGLGGLNQTYWDSLAHEFVYRSKKASVTPSYALGGFTGSRFFSSLVATAENRTTYAQSAVDFAKIYGFEGIDIDWEYPSVQGIGCNIVSDSDVENYQLFMKQIKDIWPEGKLTTAVSIAGIRSSDGTPAPAANLTILASVVDSLRIMAYDVHGSWTSTTGPHAPLTAACANPENQLSVETAIAAYLKQGFSASQLVLGIPGYGKSWTLKSPHLTPRVVQNFTSYYYQNFTGIPPGDKFDDAPGVDVCGQTTTWGGSWLVSELVSRGFLSEDESQGGSGFVRVLDECSGQPFIVRNTTFISYDDTSSTLKKVEYAKAQNLSGIFFFDTLGPTAATVTAARHALLR